MKSRFGDGSLGITLKGGRKPSGQGGGRPRRAPAGQRDDPRIGLNPSQTPDMINYRNWLMNAGHDRLDTAFQNPAFSMRDDPRNGVADILTQAQWRGAQNTNTRGTPPTNYNGTPYNSRALAVDLPRYYEGRQDRRAGLAHKGLVEAQQALALKKLQNMKLNAQNKPGLRFNPKADLNTGQIIDERRAKKTPPRIKPTAAQNSSVGTGQFRYTKPFSKPERGKMGKAY